MLMDDDRQLDRLFEVLANRNRRLIIDSLAYENPARVDSVGLLASKDLDGHDREQVETAYYHFHLPKLEDAGIIDWNMDGEAIARGENFDKTLSMMDAMKQVVDEKPFEARPEPSEAD